MLGVDHGWELVGWRTGGNFSLSLSEEQVYALFKALGIKVEELPGDEYRITEYTDEFLRLKRMEVKDNE